LKINTLYKYINLVLRCAIGVLAVYFIYERVKDDFLNDLLRIKLMSNHVFTFVVVILMMLVNWGIEALKWRYTIRSTEGITVFKAFRLTILGVTLGFLTPNRVGEIPARAFLLNRINFKVITLKTSVSSFSQVLITLLLGVVGAVFTLHHFSNIHHSLIWIITLSFGLLFLLLIYFKTNKLVLLMNRVRFLKEKEIFAAFSEFTLCELVNILIMSFLRYLVFATQYYLILNAFGISLNGIGEISLIAVCFMVASFIPTIVISEIGVRGSVALFVFGSISILESQIILASLVLWLINVALPALIGLFSLKELKLIKEN